MATDKLEVLVNALIHLGEPRVTTVTETKSVRDLDYAWDIVRKRVLRKFPFPFARSRAKLTSAATIEPYSLEFDYSHSKPSDWLRTIDLSFSGDFDNNRIKDYLDENGLIYTDHEEVWIWQVYDHQDVTAWDAIFDDLMALELAEHCCQQITDSKTLNEMKQDELKRLRASAAAISSRDLEPQERPMGKFRQSRFGDSRNRGYEQF